MLPSIELLRGRRRKVPVRHADTFRIFNLALPERSNILQKFQEESTPGSEEHRQSLEWHNTPQPRNVKYIMTNPKFLNTPISYMDTEDTKAKEDHWWPCSEPLAHHPKPPYAKQSTQRNDFQKPNCKLTRPIKYHSLLPPSRGIVPLASPQTPTRLPRIFQEQISFKHHYNARATPCIPYQGKKQGAFVCREIKPVRGTLVPEGAEALTSMQGSDPSEQPRAEKGNSVENCMTSPCLCLPDSQETPDSNAGLSKTDISVGAKADPSASEKGQISQKREVDLSYPAGEAPSCPDCLPPLPKVVQSPVET